ncbi:hypothetical protein [Streptomyces roseoverticillatus]|uniref:Uncharacterized protein n=1 Tax=Streptomyces roseoverticillatus TaxID=66429 RepID=A0ABV3J5V6_9ACTN
MFGTTGAQADVDMPAIPRIGELVLWTDEGTDDAGPYERMRQYEVRMVSWALSADAEPHVQVELRLIADVSGPPRSAD